MADKTPNGAGAPPEKALARVEKVFDRVLDELERIQDDLEEDNNKRIPEAGKVSSEARRAAIIVYEERLRLEKFRKKEAGSDNSYAIDLDAARAEIGRRLACLRDAADSTEISE